MTYSTNWKSAFTTLAAAGVSVHTYAKSAPLYIHAKVIISDDTEAFVGSENFSSNSLNKNRELGLIVTDPATLVSLQTTFEKDYAGAREFTR
jgi:phosphatidylserine/phosphatidylglycerophosphate/cardiolipin synthase-like enzyme